MPRLSSSLKKDKLTDDEQLAFIDYLKNSLKNGFSINSSLEIMPALWPKRATTLNCLSERMQTGASLADELFKLGFSNTTVVQINLSLQQGNLIECLEQLSVLHRLKHAQIRKLQAELTYPFVLAGMMALLLVFMQTFVVSNLGNGADHSGDCLILVLVLCVIGGSSLIAQIVWLLKKQDYRSLTKLAKYPLIGPTITLYIRYILVYDIGLLLASGFSLQKMCEYAADQQKGSLQQALGLKIQKKLLQGQALVEIIKEEPFLPDSLILFLKTGSKRSFLSQQCLLLGKSLFLELTYRIEKMVVNVQPVCFVLIGLCVIGMYLKLLLPMYAMMQGM